MINILKQAVEFGKFHFCLSEKYSEGFFYATKCFSGAFCGNEKSLRIFFLTSFPCLVSLVCLERADVVASKPASVKKRTPKGQSVSKGVGRKVLLI